MSLIQSYAVDKRLSVKDLRYERVDVVSGAVLTGIIGVFVVVACAATLHIHGQHIDDAQALFGVGLGGAGLLAAAVVPLLLSQALNAVLLLAILPFLRALARDPAVMGEHRLGRAGSVVTAAIIVLVAGCVLALGLLTVA